MFPISHCARRHYGPAAREACLLVHVCLLTWGPWPVLLNILLINGCHTPRFLFHSQHSVRVPTQNLVQPWESGISLTPLGCARCWEGDRKITEVLGGDWRFLGTKLLRCEPGTPAGTTWAVCLFWHPSQEAQALSAFVKAPRFILDVLTTQVGALFTKDGETRQTLFPGSLSPIWLFHFFPSKVPKEQTRWSPTYFNEDL